MSLPFSLTAPPPDAAAASKAVPLTVKTFTGSLLLQVRTALPENKKLIINFVLLELHVLQSLQSLMLILDN